MQLPTDQLQTLVAILRRGSFEDAADELAITQSAVSQRLKALEDRLGFTLVRRGRPCEGTEAGLRLAQHAEDVALLEGQALADLGLGADRPGRVRLAVNADSLDTWFAPVFGTSNALLFQIEIDDQDHIADWLRRGVVSAAVTAAGAPIPTCDVHKLGTMSYTATASPGFVAEWFAHGTSAETLARAPMLTFNSKDKLQHRWAAREAGRSLTPPTHVVPSTHAFVDAAIGGAGWGLNPTSLVRDALHDGRLQSIGKTPVLHVELVWQVTRALAGRLRPLTESVKKAAEVGLAPLV